MDLDLTADYLIWDNREPVTYNFASNVLDEPQAVDEALRRPLTDREIQASYGVYTATDVKWLIPCDLVDNDPKPRDTITDDFGVVWTVLEVGTKFALGSFWKLICRALAIVNDLKDEITIEVPTISRSATGAIVRTWTEKYTDIAARVQPDKVEEFTGRGTEATVVSYKIYVGQQLDPRNDDGDWGRVVFGTVVLEIKDYHDAEKITDLPVIEAATDVP